MLAPVRTVAPTENPVTLTEAKAHLRVDHADEDTLITALIAAATDHLDGYTGILGRALVTQTWRQDFEGFAPKLRLALRPVASVTSVTYFDGDNTSQTLSASIYGLFEDGAGPYIALDPDQTWPGSYRRVDGVSVTYVAGQAVAAVPQAIKHAILLTVGHWYANREAVSVGSTVAALPLGVDALIAPYRRVGV
jgi:uncharacterized phiE125 gp8 family phage protein